MRVLAALLAALAAVLPLACGDGDDDEPGRAVTIPAEPLRPIEIKADEYSFDPETISVTGNGDEAPYEAELEVENEGDLAHNLKVFLDDEELGGTPSFEGGESSTAELRLGPGDYRIVCTVGDHEDQGMTGKLVVR